MTLWLGWSMLVSALIAIACSAGDRVAAHLGAPRRFLWLAAMLVSSLVPVIAALVPARSSAVESGAVVSMRISEVRVIETSIPLTDVVATTTAPRARASVRDRVVAGALAIARGADAWAWRVWLLASIGWIVFLTHSVVRLRFSRRQWRDADTEIGPVLVANDTGPAVVGVFRPRIVIPAWVLDADRSTRELLLRHELEHRCAGDSRVLFGAAVLMALFPWNAALGWMARRLRLAIEIDCDTRVVRALGRRREYGLMLLSVSERYATPLSNAACLSEPGSHLEARIEAMTTLKRRHPIVSSIPFAAITLGVLTTAAWTPRPAPISLPRVTHFSSVVSVPRTATPTPARFNVPTGRLASRMLPVVGPVPPVRSTPVTLAELHIANAQLPTAANPKPLPGNPPPRYPQQLRDGGIEGYVTLKFVTDARGIPDSTTIQIVESTNSSFAEAVRRAIPLWRFDSGGVVRMGCVFRLSEPNPRAEQPPQVVTVDGQAVLPVVITGVGRARGRNIPNPFNPETFIRFAVDTAGGCVDGSRQHVVTLRVINVLTRPVAHFILTSDTNSTMSMSSSLSGQSLDNLKLGCGTYTGYWSGRLANGKEAASGIYAAQLFIDGMPSRRQKVMWESGSQDTRVRRVFSEWLTAMNSGDRAQLVAFIDKYGTARKAESAAALYEHSAVDLLRITMTDSLSLEFVIKEQKTGRTEVGFFALAPGDAGLLQSLRLLYVPPGRTPDDAALLEHLRSMRP